MDQSNCPGLHFLQFAIFVLCQAEVLENNIGDQISSKSTSWGTEIQFGGNLAVNLAAAYTI
jgi:hypothetical protein